MSDRKTVEDNLKKLYNDAVEYKMFKAATPTFEEFRHRMMGDGYQKMVFDNYKKAGIDSPNFKDISAFRGAYSLNHTDEAKKAAVDKVQGIVDLSKNRQRFTQLSTQKSLESTKKPLKTKVDMSLKVKNPLQNENVIKDPDTGELYTSNGQKFDKDESMYANLAQDSLEQAEQHNKFDESKANISDSIFHELGYLPDINGSYDALRSELYSMPLNAAAKRVEADVAKLKAQGLTDLDPREASGIFRQQMQMDKYLSTKYKDAYDDYMSGVNSFANEYNNGKWQQYQRQDMMGVLNKYKADVETRRMLKERSKQEAIRDRANKRALAKLQQTEKMREQYRREHPFLSIFRDLGKTLLDTRRGLSDETRNDLLYTAKETAAAQIANSNIKDIDEALHWRVGDRGVVGRTMRGTVRGLTNTSTYDVAGVSEVLNAESVADAANRWQSGIATPQDEDLLAAFVAQNAIKNDNSDALGGMYGAGVGLAENAQFMASMFVNPLSGIGKASAKKAASQVARWALKKFGKGITSKIAVGVAKYGARAAMDLVGAGFGSEMFGQNRIMADAIGRQMGEIKSDGNGGYIIERPKETWSESLYKAHMANAIEWASEMWGEYLPNVGSIGGWLGKQLGKGVNKAFGYDKLLNFFSKYPTTAWAKAFNQFKERTHWDGMIGEYAEEVMGNIANAATVGDMTWDSAPGTGVFNAKVNYDTFLAVALMCGIMSGVNTAGYAAFKYRAGKALDRADSAGINVLGGRWNSYKDRIDNADERQTKTILDEVAKSKDLNDTQKRIIFHYALQLAYYHGANLQNMKNKAEGRDNAQQNAYGEGRAAKGEDKHEAQNELKAKTAALAQMLNVSEEQLSNMTDEQLESLTGEDDEIDNAIYDYQTSRARMQGVDDEAKDDADNAASEAETKVDQMTDKNTDTVRPAKIAGAKGEADREVYIVSGDLETHEDGSIDRGSSSDMILYYDPQTGQIEHGDASMFTEVGEARPASEVMDEEANAARQRVLDEHKAEMDGIVQVGSTYHVLGEDGQTHEYKVLSQNADGTVNVSVDGTQITSTLEQLQELRNQSDEARNQAQVNSDVQSDEDIDDEESGADETADETSSDTSDEIAREGDIPQAPEAEVRSSATEEAQQEDNMPYDRIVNEQTGQVVPVTVEDEDGAPRFGNAQGVFLYSGKTRGNANDYLGIIVVDQNGKATKYAIKRKYVYVGDAMSKEDYKESRRPADVPTEESYTPAEDNTDYAPADETAPAVDNTEVQPTDNTEVAQPAVDETQTNEAQPSAEIQPATEAQTNTEVEQPTNTTEEAQPTNTEEETQTPATDETNTNTEAQTPAESVTLRDGTQIPMRDGNPAYEQMTPEQGADFYHDEFGDDARQVLEDEVNAAEKALKKAKESKVNGKNFQEKKASQQAKADAVKAAQQEYDTKKGFLDSFDNKKYDAKEGRHVVSDEERAQSVAENTVDDNVADIIMGKGLRKAMQKIADMMGAKLVFLQTADANGWYDSKTNTVYVALDADKALASVFGHEMTHEIKKHNEEAYQKLKDVCKDWLYDNKGDFKSLVLAKRVNYAEQGVVLSQEDAEEEAVADVIGHMINDKNMTKNIAMHLSHPILATIHRVLTEIWDKFGKSSPEAKRFHEMRETIAQAYVDTMPREEVEAEEEAQNNGNQFSLRQKPDPATTKKGYAVFVVKTDKDGRVEKLVPKMLSNDPGAPTGVWLDADTGHLKRDEEGNPLQNSIGRAAVSVNGRQSGGMGSNKLSWRPGKHLALYPNASQFAKKNGMIPSNVVFFEVEYAADEKLHKQYQRDAWSYGTDEKGEYNNTLGGLPYIPEDSYYVYRTNQIADGATPMVITGAYKINRALSDDEARKLNEKNGGMWFDREGGDLTEDKMREMGLDEAGLQALSDNFDMSKIAEHNDESEDAMSLPGYTKHDIDWDNKNLRHAMEENGQKVDDYKEGDKFSLRLQSAIDETETEPSDAQKESGNYKKGHVKFGGYDFTIENPKGSYRSGKDADGTEWKQKMNDTYGYIRGKFGKDGDHLDMFINDKADLDDWNGNVYVVDQVNKDGSFDEHKVMYGFDSEEDAKKAYLSNYEEGWQGLGNITGVSKETFDNWLNSSDRKTKPFAEYSSIINYQNEQVDNHPMLNAIHTLYTKGKEFASKLFNMKHFDVAKTPDFMKDVGLTGDKFTVRYGVVARHFGKDGSHDFTEKEWEQLPNAIKDPFAISKLADKDNGYRLYTTLKTSKGEYVVVGADVKNAGRYLEVNSIATIFGRRNNANLPKNEEVIYKSKKITPEQMALLSQPNSGQYPSIQELSAANIDNSSETSKENEEKFSLRDEEYLDAVKNGDMGKAQQMVNEAAKEAGYSTDSSYQGTSAFNGAAPWGNGYFLTKEERKEAWDNDEYEGDQTLDDYIHRGIDAMNLDFIALDPCNYRSADPMRKEAIDNVRNAIQKKSKTITMYRSVPSDVKEGKFRNGDWVTPSRAYAVDNARIHGWGDNYNIIEQKVPVDEIWWDGNDIAEWGYGREEDYVNDTDFAYKNTKNNRKLLDAVTYDNAGNVIPLSQRFNSRKSDVRYQLRSTRQEKVLRDAVIDKLRENGIDVVTDMEEGQRVLDMENDVRMSAKKKRALETASLGANPRSLTAISSADGAKVLKNIDSLVKKLENSPTQPKTFIGEMADALGIDMKDKSSKYATFECKNGNVVTIRISDHNATASNLDTNGQSDAISVVVTNKDNKGITNDGNAHIIEFYYNAIKLRKAEGKPLADIANSIKQALYSGEFKDTTGLAEKQEVNANYIREQRVYHGSGADFSEFDFDHMGEGAGSQAFGYGGYVTSSKKIGKDYAQIASKSSGLKRAELESNISRAQERLPFLKGEYKTELENEIKDWQRQLDNLEETKNLYEVNIPDDNGNNYLDWDAPLTDKQKNAIVKALKRLKIDFADFEKHGFSLDGSFGDNVYKYLNYALRDTKKWQDTNAHRAVSKFLSSLGFTGIKYYAGRNHGGAEEGDTNYVIFKPEDMQISNHVKFFLTPDGEAYGYTVDGKIYIDPRIANSETPIHEYAHLWTEAVRSVNPKEWENIVNLMKGLKPVWDKVKREYPHLKSDSDIADEVLAQYSGKRGAERLRQEYDAIADSDESIDEKSKAMYALQRLKKVLEKFWKKVADFLHIHFTTAEEVADRVMKDLLDGIAPREVAKESKVSKDADKTMFGMHNISIDKLRKAIKQGGFAAPSMAVIDTKNGIYSGYGEITLIPKAEKIAKRTGKNIGTYAADAWTPIYPSVEKKFGGNGGDVAYNDIESVPKEMQRLTRNAINSFMDGRDANGLAYLYLHEKGKAPEMVHVEGKYPKESHDEVRNILGKSDGFYDTDDEQKSKFLDLFIREVYDGNRDEFDNDTRMILERADAFIKKRPNSSLAKDKQMDVDWIKKHGYDYNALARFVDGVQRDAKTAGRVDDNTTMSAAQKYIKDNGLKEDFESWKEKLNDRYNVEEVIFAGYKSDGTRKYLPNTLENAVKVMKQDGKNASVGSASFSHFVASILKPMGTLDQIRKKKGNLTGNYEDVERFQEKWQPVYDELADKMQPDATPFESYGMDRLEEAATQRNPKKYAKDEYGVDLTDEDINKLNELIDAVKKEKPSIYFETKFMRPYGLDEFEKAIVPKDTPKDVVNALKKAGIDVHTYDGKEEREKVTMDAINDSDDIRFSLREVNDKFNERLDEFTMENADKFVFDLGRPSAKLKAAGVTDRPIRLNGSKLAKKIRKHGFEPSELKNLPLAMENPIAVFDNLGREGNRSVLTELKTANGNFLVTIDLGKGTEADFDIVSSVFGKNGKGVVYWINHDMMKYVDKEKALNYLHLSAPIAEASDNSELKSAAKIVKDFENPSISEENKSYSQRFSLRQSYDDRLSNWKKRNGLAPDEQPMDKPQRLPNESIGDYMVRMANYAKNQALWKTAPRPSGYMEALEKWKQDNGIPADEYRPSIPRKADYATEAEYIQARDKYKQEMDKWKGAPKASDYDLSVDLDSMQSKLAAINAAMINQRSFDRQTIDGITEMVKMMLALGWGDNMTRGKIGNLLVQLKKMNGNTNAREVVSDTMSLLADNYIRNLEAAYKKMTSNKGVRKDSTGVIKIGSLDAEGQALVDEHNKVLTMADKDVDDRESELLDAIANGTMDANLANARLEGIRLARIFRSTISTNAADIDTLKQQISTLDAKKNKTKAERELLLSLKMSLTNAKIERAKMYLDMLGEMGGRVSDSKEGARKFRERMKNHRKQILDLARQDMGDKDATEMSTDNFWKKFLRNPILRTIMSPTATFEQMLKFFGMRTNVNGEGGLYNYFIPKWHEAADTQQVYNEKNQSALDQKVKELFPQRLWTQLLLNGHKDMKISFIDLIGKESKAFPGMDIEVNDLGNTTDPKLPAKRKIHLKQGQMLYIYLVNKEVDGAMKLRAMGITEQDVADIEYRLNGQLKALGDWLQQEYLPECQRRYQETHIKYFGAPMADVENYFPLVINPNARHQSMDVGNQNSGNTQLSGTTTGAIVTRRVNVTPLDIENADALAVAWSHLQEMEEWSAMLPFRQDVNTLLSSKNFRNQVKNISSIAYGNGEDLWKRFVAVSQIAAGTYEANTFSKEFDKTVQKAIGLVSMAKISGRLWTAAKQTLSFPAFLPEVGVIGLPLYLKNFVTFPLTYIWARKSMPLFRKRVDSLSAGDPRIIAAMDAFDRKKNFFVKIGQMGMFPNVMIDAFTCAVGAKTVYDVWKSKYIRLGYPEAKAEEKALLKASLAYNKSQQSSENAFVSSMQVDRTYLASALSLFKNSNYAYGRSIIEAARGLANSWQFWGSKHKRAMISSMTAQIQAEEGFDEDVARGIAKNAYNNAVWHNVAVLATYGALLPILWQLGSKALYLILGDDDDKKKHMLEEAAAKGLATSVTDDYAIPFVSNYLNAGIYSDEDGVHFGFDSMKNQNLYVNPTKSDIANILNSMAYGNFTEAEYQSSLLIAQAFMGLNPATLGSVMQSFIEKKENADGSKKNSIQWAEILNAPESNIRDLYMDELGLNGNGGNGVTIDEVSNRYGKRQVLKNQGILEAAPWNDTDAAIQKYQARFEKRIQEYIDNLEAKDPAKMKAVFNSTTDPKMKAMIAKSEEKKAKEGMAELKKPKAEKPAHEQLYESMRTYDDMIDDVALRSKNQRLRIKYAKMNNEYKRLKETEGKYVAGDYVDKHEDFYNFLELEKLNGKIARQIQAIKKEMVDSPAKERNELMDEIRELRKEYMDEQSKVR